VGGKLTFKAACAGLNTEYMCDVSQTSKGYISKDIISYPYIPKWLFGAGYFGDIVS
jgi:hypothetical protein